MILQLEIVIDALTKTQLFVSWLVSIGGCILQICYIANEYFKYETDATSHLLPQNRNFLSNTICLENSLSGKWSAIEISRLGNFLHDFIAVKFTIIGSSRNI